jgi:hypothetical protein
MRSLDAAALGCGAGCGLAVGSRLATVGAAPAVGEPAGAAPAMADGGLFVEGLLGLLEPEEALRLFSETGSAAAGQRR